MDWGLARLLRSVPASGDRALMNQPGPVGTPQFMAPEQARGKIDEVDERSDIFGLGALLYEILSGECPYGRVSTDAILKRAKAGEVVPIDDACQRFAIAKRIRAICARATHPDPSERFQSVSALKDALVAFLKGGLHLPQKHFAPGEIIVTEGDKGDAAYMIVAGKCRAFRTTLSGEETLSIMEPGETFGEMALVLFEPRAASVAAIDDVTVLVLDQATLNEGLGLSGWTGALVRALAQRFADLEHVVRESGIRRGTP
jgi:serine/threonine-protein kinase